MVNSFKYLRQVLTAVGDDWPVVMGNLKKERKSWSWLTRTLGREGRNLRVSGMFFKAVVQAVLIFGSETWVMTPRMGHALGSFQNVFAWQITGRQPRRREGEGWIYPPLAAAMKETGWEEIGVYIRNRLNTVAQYIATRSIMDLCERTVRRLGGWIARRWWEQEGINIAGEREQTEAAADREEERGKKEAVCEETTGRN